MISAYKNLRKEFIRFLEHNAINGRFPNFIFFVLFLAPFHGRSPREKFKKKTKMFVSWCSSTLVWTNFSIFLLQSIYSRIKSWLFQPRPPPFPPTLRKGIVLVFFLFNIVMGSMIPNNRSWKWISLFLKIIRFKLWNMTSFCTPQVTPKT